MTSIARRPSKARTTNEIGPRAVKYDPTDLDNRIDPMLFGAYRRWKVVEQETAKKKSKGKSLSKNKKAKSSTEKFYDALKNFGSAPSEVKIQLRDPTSSPIIHSFSRVCDLAPLWPILLQIKVR